MQSVWACEGVGVVACVCCTVELECSSTLFLPVGVPHRIMYMSCTCYNSTVVVTMQTSTSGAACTPPTHHHEASSSSVAGTAADAGRAQGAAGHQLLSLGITPEFSRLRITVSKSRLLLGRVPLRIGECGPTGTPSISKRAHSCRGAATVGHM